MISLIVIEYNSVDEIQKCVNYVEKCCGDIDYELIVSSNSQYPESKQLQLQKDFPSVIWSFNDRNGGFAYGMNQGLAIAKGDHLVVMNPDVQLKDSIAPLSDFLSNHIDVGAVAPQIVGYDGEIQDSCRKFVTPLRFFVRQLRRLLTNKIAIRNNDFDYNRIQTVDSVIGAFIMVKRQVFEKVGNLDESYFLYAEDIDWCTRIWQSGYQVVYNPTVQIVYEGSRRARTTLKYAKIFMKSHFFYWKKFGFSRGYPQIDKKYFD